MTEAAPEEKILSRVRKLLALANNTAASEGERDNALRMAHATLTKHAMTMADVNAFDREKADPRGQYDLEGWNLPWNRQIRAAVAKLFMCSYFYQKINATRGKHSFVGRESNATTAMYLSDFIILGMLKECDKRYGHRLTPGGRSFGEGAAAKLWSRVYDLQRAQREEFAAADAAKQRAAAQAAADAGDVEFLDENDDASTPPPDVVLSTGTALMLVDLPKREAEDNEAWIKDNVGGLVKAKARNSKVDPAAYRAGREHAASISLNVQVGVKKGAKQIS